MISENSNIDQIEQRLGELLVLSIEDAASLWAAMGLKISSEKASILSPLAQRALRKWFGNASAFDEVSLSTAHVDLVEVEFRSSVLELIGEGVSAELAKWALRNHLKNSEEQTWVSRLFSLRDEYPNPVSEIKLTAESLDRFVTIIEETLVLPDWNDSFARFQQRNKSAWELSLCRMFSNDDIADDYVYAILRSASFVAFVDSLHTTFSEGDLDSISAWFLCECRRTGIVCRDARPWLTRRAFRD